MASYIELKREAIRLERLGKYEAARAKWAEARKAALGTSVAMVEYRVPEGTDPTVARQMRQDFFRALKNGISPGQRFERRNREGRVFECVYIGPGDWVCGGVHYTSATAAANATVSSDSNTKAHGWKFWGIER